MKYREVMSIEQAPCVYDGPNFDEHRPNWLINEVGAGEVDFGGADLSAMKANCFPAGTKIVITVPLCPECEAPADLGHFAESKKCDCGFDWKEWTENEYS